MRIFHAGALLVCASLLQAGCGGGGGVASAPTGPPSEGLALTLPRETLPLGTTVVATVKRVMVVPGMVPTSQVKIITPTPGETCCVTNPETGITWMSLNRDVLTVDEDGNVTAVGTGQTYVAATMRSSDGSKVLSGAVGVTVLYERASD